MLSKPLLSMGHQSCDPAKTGTKLMSVAPLMDPRVAQLIDANLDRAREGLRVVEDWCRFALDSEDFVISLKDWRQRLGRHHHDIYKQARSIDKDQGIGLSHPAQKGRHSPLEIISANCARVQEALRVLEEFSREPDPDLSKNAALIRYGLYELEVKILKASISMRRQEKLQQCSLCLITSPQKDLIRKVAKALTSGVKMVQFRSKKGADIDNFLQAKELANICKQHESLFIINDRIDLTLAVNADGVHLGQNDLPTKVARKLLGNEYLIGRSTHSLNQIKAAEDEGCNYLGVGPIFATPSKPELKPVSTKFIHEAVHKAQLPWFAIGGINNSNLNEVCLAGAKRIAVLGAIMNAEDTSQASLELLKGLQCKSK